MGRRIGKPMITTSVRISPEFHKLCLDHGISFSEALRVGISLTLAEKGVKEYDNNLNIVRKRADLIRQLEDISQKFYELKGKKSLSSG